MNGRPGRLMKLEMVKQKKRLRELWDKFKKVERFCNLGELKDCKDRLTVHHINPQSNGGSDRKSNLMILCYQHHMHIHHPSQYKKTKIFYYNLLKAKFNKIGSS